MRPVFVAPPAPEVGQELVLSFVRPFFYPCALSEPMHKERPDMAIPSSVFNAVQSTLRDSF